MSGTINATASITDVETSPGVFDYTVSLNNTGGTTIGTFWFGWIPGQDYMSAQPTTITEPAGWSDTVTTNAYPGGTGYAIEWTANSSASYIPPGLSSSAFTFSSTETPAQLAANSPFATSTPTATAFVYQGPALVPQGAQIVASVGSSGGGGIISGLDTGQQLELIYLAYFNRAGDAAGFTYWAGQNVQAQDGGQSATIALNNIANAFTPQPETLALYPFLSTTNLDLTSPTAQAGLTTFITALYENMFGHAPDAPGAAYWLGQLTTGAVGLGAAALAIANGATGADAIAVQNKLNVALDFTIRSELIGASTSTTTLAAATNVLKGVDGLSLNDASVTAGMTATTAFIASATSASGLNITGTGNLLNTGAGVDTIQFLPGASADTINLGVNGLSMVAGFAAGSDILDFNALLTAAGVNLNGSFTTLGNYVTITDQGPDALVSFDPTGHAGGNVVAVLQGSGSSVTSLATLVAQGSVRIT